MLMQQELVPCVCCGNRTKFSRGIPTEPVASGQHPWTSEAESESSGHPVSILQRRGRGSEREEPGPTSQSWRGLGMEFEPKPIGF